MPSPPVHRVSLPATPPGGPVESRAALALARALELSASDARLLLRSVRVLPRDFSLDAALALVQTLAAAGVAAEAMPLLGGGQQRCREHPSLSPDAMCEDCRQSICLLCTLNRGAPRCSACALNRARRRRFQRIRIALLLLALAAAGYRGWSHAREKERRSEWLRPLEVSVVLLSEAEVPEPTFAAWSNEIPRLESWFRSEYARHRADGLTPFHLTLYAPVRVETTPSFEPASKSWLDRARHAWRLTRTLGDIDARAQVAKESDLRLYVVLRGAGARESQWVDGVAEAGGTLGMVRAPLAETELGLPLTALAHELLHCLGATDKYDAEGHARVPEGLAEPERTPRFPQDAAEVMAGEVPEGPSRGRPPGSLAEVRVGAVTAFEVRWR